MLFYSRVLEQFSDLSRYTPDDGQLCLTFSVTSLASKDFNTWTKLQRDSEEKSVQLEHSTTRGFSACAPLVLTSTPDGGDNWRHVPATLPPVPIG
jgi:hypothetical protein